MREITGEQRSAVDAVHMSLVKLLAVPDVSLAIERRDDVVLACQRLLQVAGGDGTLIDLANAGISLEGKGDVFEIEDAARSIEAEYFGPRTRM